MVTVTDVDIDVADREKVLNIFPAHIPAMMLTPEGKERKHNSGVYFHQVPVNPVTGTCSVHYKQAEELGFFKIDILNFNLYQNINDEEHLYRLMNQEPIWELLEHKDFCDMLIHLKGHHHVCKTMKPKTIEELAMVLAIIRPAKKHLMWLSWQDIRKEIWTKPEDGDYYFKRSHGMAYAVAVVVHMNLICETL